MVAAPTFLQTLKISIFTVLRWPILPLHFLNGFHSALIFSRLFFILFLICKKLGDACYWIKASKLVEHSDRWRVLRSTHAAVSTLLETVTDTTGQPV
ncbi:hypothetical protein Hdeb2414_s0020g00554341 [Helianthus debilis subsp. tardiflorus]